MSKSLNVSSANNQLSLCSQGLNQVKNPSSLEVA